MSSIRKIIHLSDLHISSRGKEFYRVARVFDAVGRAYPRNPVLITGYIVDSGRRDEMELAQTLVEHLSKTNPVLVVPGNHDYAWKGIVGDKGAWKCWQKCLGSPLGWNGQSANPTWLTGTTSNNVDGLGIWPDPENELVYFGVDSGDPDNNVATAKGYISQYLADALKSELQDHSDKCRVVFLHHHPFDDGAFMKLVGAEHFLNAVHGNCEVLLFGHDHHLGVWRNRESIPIIVASHKTSSEVFEHHLMINVVEVLKSDDTGKWSFWHRLELV